MTPKTKPEAISALRALADKLIHLDEDLPIEFTHFSIVQYFYEKTKLTDFARAIGGKWKKVVIGGDEMYSSIHLQHETLPLTLTIARDKVCRKIVKYECEPIFSPEEESELEVTLNG